MRHGEEGRVPHSIREECERCASKRLHLAELMTLCSFRMGKRDVKSCFFKKDYRINLNMLRISEEKRHGIVLQWQRVD